MKPNASLPPILYAVMTAATGIAAGTQGLVPAPAAGDQAKVLTGAGTWVAQAAGFADPMTTIGDMIVRDGTNTTARLGIGANGYALLSNGTIAAWGAVYQDPLTTNGDVLVRAGGVTTRLAVGSAGDVLTVVAGVLTWVAPSGATPAGADTQVQYNNAGAFGASSGMTWNNTTKTMTLTGTGGTASTLAVVLPVSAVAGVSITANSTNTYGLRMTNAAMATQAMASFEGVDGSGNALISYLGSSVALTGNSFAGYFSATGTTSIPIGVLVVNTNTNNIVPALSIYARSTGTPATSFGASSQTYLETSTTNDVYAGHHAHYWATATHATRTSGFVVQLVLSGVAANYLTLTPTNMQLGANTALTVATTTSTSVALDVSAAGAYATSPSQAATFRLVGATTTVDVAAIEVTKAITASYLNVVHNIFRIGTEAGNSLAVTVGFGLAIDWWMRSNGSTTRIRTGNLAVVYTNATAATAVTDMVVTLMNAGTMTEAGRWIGTGALRIGTAAAYVQHQPSSGTTTYTWPTGYPIAASGYYLTSNTTGTLSWAAVSGMADPMTTIGDIILRDGVNATVRLGVGSAGDVLTVVAGVPAWVAGMTNPMTTNGDMIYRAAGVPARLAIGATDGLFLVTNGGAPEWSRTISEAPATMLLSLRNINAISYGVLSLGDVADSSQALTAASAGTAATFEGQGSGSTITVTNSGNSWTTLYNILTLTKTGTGGAAGNGVMTLYNMWDDGNVPRDAGVIGVSWEYAGTAAYTSAFIVRLTSSAAAIATVWYMNGHGAVTHTNTSATTNAAVTVMTTTLATTGTAAASLAARHLYQIEDDGGTLSDAVALDVVLTDATAASEDATYQVRVAVAGTLALAATIAGTYIDISPAAGELRINGTKVLDARITGWGAPTGTPTRSTFATSTVTLEQLAERVMALIDDSMAHGFIGT